MYTRFEWGALRRLSVRTKQGSELLQWFRMKERHSRVEGIDDNQFRRQSRNESRRCRRRSRRSLVFNVCSKAQPIKVHHFLCLGRLSRATWPKAWSSKSMLFSVFPKAQPSKVWCFRCFRVHLGSWLLRPPTQAENLIFNIYICIYIYMHKSQWGLSPIRSKSH